MSLLASAEAIIKRRDAKKFAALVGELGLDLPFERFFAYLEKHVDGPYPDLTASYGGGGLQLAHAALTSEHGFAMEVIYGATTLVARAGDRLLFAMQDGSHSKPFKKWGWTITPRWYKDPAKNGPTIANWIRDPKRQTDALAIPIIRSIAPTKIAGDDRGTALLATVCAHPEDIAARLVYGDWLAEQGDVCGELIRVQCDLEAARTPALAKREKQLLDAYGKTLKAPLARWVERCSLRRGLVEHVEMFSDVLVKHGAKIAAQHPITHLELNAIDADDVTAVAQLPLKLTRLVISGRERKHVVNSGAVVKPSRIATAPVFARVRELALYQLKDSPAELAKFFATLVAPALENLDIDTHLDAKALAALGRSTTLPKLCSVELGSSRDTTYGTAGLAALVERKTLARVGLDGWRDDRVIAKAVAILLASPRLEMLMLRNLDAGVATVAALAKHGRHLRGLGISDARELDLATLAGLLESLRTLHCLVVGDVPGDEAACEAFTVAVCKAPKTLAELTWRGGSNATKDQAERIRASGRAYAWRPTEK